MRAGVCRARSRHRLAFARRPPASFEELLRTFPEKPATARPSRGTEHPRDDGCSTLTSRDSADQARRTRSRNAAPAFAFIPVVACNGLPATHRSSALAGDRTSGGRDRPDLRAKASHAEVSSRRRAAPGIGVVPSLRLPGHLELPPSRERQQVRSHPTGQWNAGAHRPSAGDASGAVGRRPC